MILHSDAAGLRGHPTLGATAASLGRKANQYFKGKTAVCQIEPENAPKSEGNKADRNSNQGLGMVAETSFEKGLSSPDESTAVAT